jgi:hypothetical protein
MERNAEISEELDSCMYPLFSSGVERKAPMYKAQNRRINMSSAQMIFFEYAI